MPRSKEPRDDPASRPHRLEPAPHEPADLDRIHTAGRDRLGHELDVLGILPTRVDRRNSRVTRHVLDELSALYGPLLMDTRIPVNSALARTASLGGNMLLKSTTSGTQVLAATPVRARPTSSPWASWAAPVIQALTAQSSRPPKIKGLRRPTQSAAMPRGQRTMACHRPYWAMTTPTMARSVVLVLA